MREPCFPTYFYSSPPVSPDKLDHPQNKLIPFGNSTYLLAYDKGRKMVGVYGKLQKSDTFLARELYGYPGILEVATFSAKDKKDADMPESGDAIEIQQKGYVLASQVRPAKKEKLEFKPFEGSVFVNEDLISDVKQNNLGDCFLLSSALAILHRKHGDEYIKSMMIADGDYTIVRLFHPETLQPCYIRVQNSYYHHNGKNKVLHEAPWVHILEKAYTAFAFKSVGDAFKVTYPALREMYGNGGDPDVAMTILTGERAVSQKITQSQAQEQARPYPLSSDQLLQCVAAYYAEQQLGRLFSDVNPINDYLVAENADVLPEVIACLKQNKDIHSIIADVDAIEKKHDKGLSIVPLLTSIENEVDADSQREYLHDLIVYFKKFADLKLEGSSAVEQTLLTMREFVDFGKYLFLKMQECGAGIDAIFTYEKKISNLEELIEYFRFLENPPVSFPAKYLQRLREHAFKDENILDAPLDVGLYSEKSRAIFDDIERKLSDKNQSYAISATTLPKFDEKVAGLRSRHVYSVVRTEKDKNGMRYVVVRNPWGNTGREYNFDQPQQPNNNNLVVENKANAESRLVLSDFVKYFSSYSVGKFNTDQIENVYYHASQPKQESFLRRHWGKMLVGAVLLAAVVVAGVFTFGAVPAIAAGVTAAFAFTGVTLSVTAATALGVTALGVAAAVVGAIFSAVAGKIKDVCTRSNFNEYEPLPCEPVKNMESVVPVRRSSTADVMNVFECDKPENMSAEVAVEKDKGEADQQAPAVITAEENKDEEVNRLLI